MKSFSIPGAVLAALVLGSVTAFAVPFDVVVPREIQIDTTLPSSGVQFEYWGWVIATSDTITQEDLNSAQITIEIGGSDATVDQVGFKNTAVLAPLIPGEVAGYRLDPENAAAYDSLLSGESLKAPTTPFWTTLFEFNMGPTDTTALVDTLTVTGTITMNGDELSYSTTVYFGDYSVIPVVALGQRVSSTPIPVLVRRTSWGDLKSKFLKRDP